MRHSFYPTVTQRRDIDKESYAERARTFFGLKLMETAPEFADQVEVTSTEVHVGRIALNLDFRFDSRRDSYPLSPDQPSPFQELTDQKEVDSRLAHAASRRIQDWSGRLPVDLRSGYPVLPESIELEQGVASYVYRHACSDCSGKKKVPCSKCKGVGTHTCRACLGKSEVRCPECHGRGTNSAYSESRQDCTRCRGRTVIDCDACSRTGSTRCPGCKGKKAFPCVTCSASGYMRDVHTVGICAYPNYRVKVLHGPRDIVLAAVDLFGGEASITPEAALLVDRRIDHDRAYFEFLLPIAHLELLYAHRGSGVTCAGCRPRILASGDLIETALSSSMDDLSHFVNDSNIVVCDRNGVSSRLASFLRLTPHRLSMVSGQDTPDVLTASYVGRVRDVVARAVRTVRSNLYFTHVSPAVVAGPFLYLVLHRAVGLTPYNSLFPIGALLGLSAAVAYIRWRTFLTVVAPDPDLRDVLSSL